jgi:hypothetical protein
MAIIKKYRYWLSQPRGGKDQVNGMVSIDIARFNYQPASRCNKLNRLPPGFRKLKLNPVVGTRRVAPPGLNAGYVGVKVSVKIINRKLWARSDRSDGAILNICGLRCAEASETKEHRH